MTQTINGITHETFEHVHEPNSWRWIKVDHVEPVEMPVNPVSWGKDYRIIRAENGWVRVHGVVLEGGETSRIFQHSRTRDLAGEAYTVEVPPDAWQDGKYRTIAM